MDQNPYKSPQEANDKRVEHADHRQTIRIIALFAIIAVLIVLGRIVFEVATLIFLPWKA